MLAQDEIERQLQQLYKAYEHWSRKSEESIKRRDFQSIAPRNADTVYVMIQALEFVLEGKPLPPLYEDNGNRYSLAPEESKTRKKKKNVH